VNWVLMPTFVVLFDRVNHDILMAGSRK